LLVTLGAPFREPWGTGRPREEYLAKIREFVPEGWNLLVPSDVSEGALLKIAGEADAVLGGSISGRVMERAPNLRVIQTIGSGVDKIDLDAAVRRRITVCSTRGMNAVAVAEHIFALMLSLAK